MDRQDMKRRLRAFETWMKRVGIEWDPEYMRLDASWIQNDEAKEDKEKPQVVSKGLKHIVQSKDGAIPGERFTIENPDFSEREKHSLDMERQDDYTNSENLTVCTGLGLGIIALKDIEEGRELCSIPKSACISIRTSGIADVLEQESLGGGLGLIVAVLYEMSLGKASPWYEYLNAIPTREYLPIFWNEQEISALEGTELQDSAATDKEAMLEDFESHVAPIPNKYPGRFIGNFVTFHNFMNAASLVASRAFGIDEFHGESMVPLADIFNHKCSVVELSDEYAVVEEEAMSQGTQFSNSSEENCSSDDSYDDGQIREDRFPKGNVSFENSLRSQEVNTESLSADATNHVQPVECYGLEEQSIGEVSESSRKENQEGISKEVKPIHAKSDEQIVLHGMSTANGLHLKLQIGIIEKGDNLLIVAASPISCGNEIHNTYGELGNADLVKKYAFCLTENPFTSVNLCKNEVIQACEDVQKALQKIDDDGTENKIHEKRGKERKNKYQKIEVHSSKDTRCFDADFQLRKKMLLEDTEWLDEDEEPFEIYPNGFCSASLLATLRILCSKTNTTIDKALYDPVERNELAVSSWATVGMPTYCENINREGFMTLEMAIALLRAIESRMKRYRPFRAILDQTDTLLDSLEDELLSIETASCPLDDSACARRSALMLRYSEIKILSDMRQRLKKYKTRSI